MELCPLEASLAQRGLDAQVQARSQAAHPEGPHMKILM